MLYSIRVIALDCVRDIHESSLHVRQFGFYVPHGMGDVEKVPRPVNVLSGTSHKGEQSAAWRLVAHFVTPSSGSDQEGLARVLQPGAGDSHPAFGGQVALLDLDAQVVHAEEIAGPEDRRIELDLLRLVAVVAVDQDRAA